MSCPRGPEPAMRISTRPWALWAAASVAVCTIISAAACTDAQLRCIGPACQSPGSSDKNVVRATGKVCTVDPKTSTYPYKIVIVVDISGSTKQTDPLGGRGRAVTALINQYKDNPAVSFAVVVFDTTPVALQPTFTRDPALLAAAAAQVDQHGQATNYLSTLGLVRQIIDTDAKAARAVDNRFTQYDVQWLSDGNPEIPPDITDQASLLQHCSQTRPLVKQAVVDLMALKGQDNFFNITLSTLFLDYVPANPADALVINCQPLIKQDPATWGTGPAFLMDMASAGMGSYQQLTSANLKFDIKINSIVRRYLSHSLFLTNTSRVVHGDSLLADSDQDGVDDAQEQGQGLDPTRAVTGSHGCGDLAEARSTDNPGLCDQVCSGQAVLGTGALGEPTTDRDTDGLLACEESVLLSDDNKCDSNLDGVPDSTAVRFGSNPIDPTTATRDSDLDGVNDLQEMIEGTDPTTAQHDRSLAYAYKPLQAAESTASGVDCYTFEVDNVRLAATSASEVSAAGDNVICLQMVQNSVDDPTGQPLVTRACKTVNMTASGQSVSLTPASGELQFSPGDFVTVMSGSVAPNS